MGKHAVWWALTMTVIIAIIGAMWQSGAADRADIETRVRTVEMLSSQNRMLLEKIEMTLNRMEQKLDKAATFNK